MPSSQRRGMESSDTIRASGEETAKSGPLAIGLSRDGNVRVSTRGVQLLRPPRVQRQCVVVQAPWHTAQPPRDHSRAHRTRGTRHGVLTARVHTHHGGLGWMERRRTAVSALPRPLHSRRPVTLSP